MFITYWAYHNGQVVKGKSFKSGTGVLHGPILWYDRSGRLEQEDNYLDGKAHGRWVEYSSGGQIRLERHYKNGKLNRKWVRNYGAGQGYREGEYRDGKKEGPFVSYDESGNVIDRDIYEGGECIDQCEGND